MMAKDTDLSIEIPREPTFLREYCGESAQQSLPVTARPRRAILLPLAAFCLAMGAMFLLVSGVIMASSSASMLDVLLKWLFVLVIVPAAATFFLVAGAIFVRQALLPNPALLLDEDGILDVRSLTRKVRWQEIESARIWVGGNGATVRRVLLKFRPEVDRGRLVRKFSLTAWTMRPWHADVLVSFMDQRSHMLAYTILALVRRGGGAAPDLDPPSGAKKQ